MTHALVQELRQIQSFSKPSRGKPHRQTRSDFLIKKAGFTCSYCHRKEPKRKLTVIKKNHTINEDQIFEPKNNQVVACKKCASLKGGRDHKEFHQHLQKIRKKQREEIMKNYPAIAERVFKRYNYECIFCKYEYGYTPDNIKLTIDHKNSIHQMGTNDEKNLACGCEKHNREKGAMDCDMYFNYLKKRGRKFTKKAVAN